jgi:hypothetical protein
MMQDELRYYCHNAFCNLERESTPDLGAYNELVNAIGECLYATADQRTSRLQILNPNLLAYYIDIKPVLDQITRFVNSSAFLHVAQDKATASQPMSGDSGPVRNLIAETYTRHSRIYGAPSVKNETIQSWIQSIEGKLDEQTLKALKEQLHI